MNTQYHQCSGCENVCEIEYQYCKDCRYESDLEDLLDDLDIDDYGDSYMLNMPCVACDHEWIPTHEGSDHYTCRYCGVYYG
jgi:hypothetical protein